MLASGRPQTISRNAPGWTGDEETRHRLVLRLAWAVAIALLAAMLVYGFPYYRLDLAARARSPYNASLRPSGPIGIRLGMLGLGLFLLLFLYPLRKRWTWLGRIGKTKHWLDFHILFGITAPIVITLHSSFKLGGLAGAAYWIMIAVALSGFVGRYLYAQIPRTLKDAELDFREMEAERRRLSAELHSQALLTETEMAPLLTLPSQQEAARMSAAAAVWKIFLLDVARPFRVSRLRRRLLAPAQIVLTLGGLLGSGNSELEGVVAAVRRQSWLSTKLLFLSRMHRLFHSWHVVHRPFSYAFIALAIIHITVALLFGYF